MSNPATFKCPNCSQPMLESDSSCWQCGWESAQTGSRSLESSSTNQGSPTSDFPLAAFFIYAAATIFILLLLMLVMRSLGNIPTHLAGGPGSFWYAIQHRNVFIAIPQVM